MPRQYVSTIAGLAGVASANTFTKAQTITPDSSAVGLIVKANSAQATDIMQVQDSAGNVLWGIDQYGRIKAPLTGEYQPTPSLGSTCLPNTGSWVVDPTTAPTVATTGTSGNFSQATDGQYLLVSYAWASQSGTITNATGTGSTVTFTCTNALNVGQLVVVEGVAVSAGTNYNGVYTVATSSATQFTASGTASGTYSSGGTFRGGLSQLAPPTQLTMTGTAGSNQTGIQASCPAFPTNINAVVYFVSTTGNTTSNLPSGYKAMGSATSNGNSTFTSALGGSAPTSNQTGTTTLTTWPSATVTSDSNDERMQIAYASPNAGTLSSSSGMVIVTFRKAYPATPKFVFPGAPTSTTGSNRPNAGGLNAGALQVGLAVTPGLSTTNTWNVFVVQ